MKTFWDTRGGGCIGREFIQQWVETSWPLGSLTATYAWFYNTFDIVWRGSKAMLKDPQKAVTAYVYET